MHEGYAENSLCGDTAAYTSTPFRPIPVPSAGQYRRYPEPPGAKPWGQPTQWGMNRDLEEYTSQKE